MSRTHWALVALLVIGTLTASILLNAGGGRTETTFSGLPEVPVERRTSVSDARLLNAEAPVPPQCYTLTEGVHNPCYACHQSYDRREQDRLNQLDDGHLQGGYEFSEIGVENHWTNLFVDRREWVASITDEMILAYVDGDNYSPLAGALRHRGFQGFTPDLADYAQGTAAFDGHGLARDGSYWVAFNYKPFPGTFWPTNGSTDDVVIRLPREFRERGGQFDRGVYYVNLTLVELTIKDLESASIWPVDEAGVGFDVDRDGVLGTATVVVRSDHYVGDAAQVAVEFQQFPSGTEIMHSVRYLDVQESGRIGPSRRMKELRYMRKVRVFDRATIAGRYAHERREKRLGELPSFVRRGDEGLDNGLGWFVQGFIEDYDGSLRPQSYEETMFCMGCHTSIATTIDSTFSFARKVTGATGWGYIDLVGMPDAPSVAETSGEIARYLARAGGGSEFRENAEMVERFFLEDGTVNNEALSGADVYSLVTPSRRRALDLDKAYLHIVRHQSFIHGRDATIAPVTNVLRHVDETIAPLEPERRFLGWDLRLDWSSVEPG